MQWEREEKKMGKRQTKTQRGNGERKKILEVDFGRCLLCGP